MMEPGETVPTRRGESPALGDGFASCVREQVLAARSSLADALAVGDDLAAAAATSRLGYLLRRAGEHGVAVPEGV